MAKVAITESYLENIADAIRTKTGISNATYLPSQMASAILTISGSGGITPTGTISIEENGTYDVTNYASANVSVPTGSTINNQNKSVTPTESSQSITYDNGYTGLGTVTVGAISSTYVGSGITTNPTPTASGATVTIPAGYYSTQTTKSVDSGTAGTPTASKGTVSNHAVSVTPSVTNTAGYISGGTKTGTAVTINASELVSGNKAISSNGTNIDVTNYATVSVNVPTGSTISNQDKTVNPSTSQQQITADEGYTGLGTVTITAMPSLTLPTSVAASATSGYTKKATVSRSTSTQYINIGTGYNAAGGYYEISAVANGTEGTPTATKGTVSNHSILVTPSVTNTAGYISGSTKTGTAVTVSASELVSGTLSVTSNGTKDVTNYASISVNISDEAPNIESLSITPSELQQTFNSNNVDGYKPVTVSAISSTYVGSSIDQLDSSDLTVSGATVTAPAGYYAEAASKSVSSMTLPTAAASSATSGYTSKATIGRSTAAQYINIPPGYNSAGAYYVISAVANGSATAPASISGTAASVSTGNGTLTLTKTVSVTPSVTAGYVSSGTAGNSSVSLTASVTIDPTPTANGATVTIPAGYYTDSTTKSVSSGSATGPTSLSGSSATITTGTNTITLTKTGVTTTPTVSAGYVSSATASTATVALTASVTVNPTPTASGATVTIPAGYYSSQTTKSVSSGSATAPSTISGTAASVSTGTNTLTLTKTVSVTPTVSAGYVSAGTAGNASVSLTASITTKAAATITPTTTDQTIAAGTYLTGAQTIAGDADLVGSNILSTANIFGVQGAVVVQNYYTGSSAPSSSLGQNGDIYIQQ